jgi:hypothetical protein
MTNVLWCFKEEVEADDFMAEDNEIGNRLAAMADRSGVSIEKLTIVTSELQNLGSVSIRITCEPSGPILPLNNFEKGKLY